MIYVNPEMDWEDVDRMIDQIIQEAREELGPKPARNSKSRHKNISRHGHRWRLDFKGKYIGLFETLDAAIMKRDELHADNTDTGSTQGTPGEA